MAACRSAMERKTPRRMRCRVIFEEKVLDGVEPGSRGRGEVEGPTRMTRQPGQHLGMLVGGIVVEDDMDRPIGRDLALDGIEEANEFEMAVALHAAANHGAIEHAERGEQGGGAVPLVIVCHGLAAPGLDRQSGLGAVEGLDLALFVDRQHHRMRRRIDIEPDNVGELGGKAGIARSLERAQPVRLKFVRPPDALHRTHRDADGFGHRPACPVGRLVRRRGAS